MFEEIIDDMLQMCYRSREGGKNNEEKNGKSGCGRRKVFCSKEDADCKKGEFYSGLLIDDIRFRVLDVVKAKRLRITRNHVDGSGPLHQKNHCSNVPFGINR
jgi:hypothetical protein